MRRLARRSLRIGLLCAGAVAASGGAVRAQELEPRTLSPAPVGLNFVGAGYGQAQGGLSVDQSLPLVDPNLRLTGPVLGYARSLDLLGLSGKLDVVLPMGRLSGTARFQGQPVSRQQDGVGDPLVRVSAILWGAPAMTPDEFKAYRQGLLIAAGLQLGLPFGSYEASKLLNLGDNRWTIRPDIGASKTFGRWVVELRADVTLYTENTDFFGDRRRDETPIWAEQGHLIYNWPSGAWASLDAMYYSGGQGKLDGVRTGTSLQNGRAGGSLALPVTRRHSIKFYGSAGISTRTHNNFRLLGIAWQYRWGAGV